MIVHATVSAVLRAPLRLITPKTTLRRFVAVSHKPTHRLSGSSIAQFRAAYLIKTWTGARK